MDLKQLKYFVTVAELGSFTRAAIALDVAQPALSRQVRALETEFRQHLLQRTGRGVVPTDAGRQLLESGRGLLHQAQRLKEELGHARGALVGRVVLGLPPSLSRALAVPLFQAFDKHLPDAQLSLGTALTRELEDSLAIGTLDLAVLYGSSATVELELEPLTDDTLVLAYPADCSVRHVDNHSLEREVTAGFISLETLAGLPLIIPRQPNAIRMCVESEIYNAGYRINIAQEVDSISAILDLVDSGYGCAVLSSRALKLARIGSSVSSCKIVEPELSIPLLMATSKRRPRTDTIDAVIRIVTSLLGD